MYFKQHHYLVNLLFFYIYHQVNHNLNVNIITLSDPKTTNERREKTSRRRETQTREEEKWGWLINSSFSFYILFFFLFFNFDLSKIIFVYMLNFYHRENWIKEENVDTQVWYCACVSNGIYNNNDLLINYWNEYKY